MEKPSYSSSQNIEKVERVISSPLYIEKTQKINQFTKEYLKQYQMPLKNENTSIVDILYGKPYNPPRELYISLLDHLNELQKSDIAMHYTERQSATSYTHSGLMLDYDLACETPFTFPGLSTNIYETIIRRVLKFDFAKDFTTNAFVIARRQSDIIDVKDSFGTTRQAYKYGFHIVFPNLHCCRKTKQDIIRKISGDKKIIRLLTRAKVINASGALDLASSSVPVHVYGSCKRNRNEFYRAAYYCIVSREDDSVSIDCHKEAHEIESLGFNLVREMSINPTIPKTMPAINIPSAVEEIVIPTPPEEPGIDDVDYNLLTRLLDVLPAKYHDEYLLWRDTLCTIANISQDYKELARQFSMSMSDKFDESSFEETWEYACGWPQEQRKFGIETLCGWVKKEDPENLRKILDSIVISDVRRHIRQFNGEVTDELFAMLFYNRYKGQILGDMVGGKYVWWIYNDEAEGKRAKKWVRHENNFVISSMVTSGLREPLNNLRMFFAMEDDCVQKKNILKNLTRMCKNIETVSCIKNIVAKIKEKFYTPGTYKKMDKNGAYFGCRNGVLKLKEQAEYIEGSTGILLERYTNLNYTPFDPANPTAAQLRVLGWIRDIIYEIDARHLIMMFLATGLSGCPKAAKMLLWKGIGANGKSGLLKLWEKTIGSHYAVKLPMQLLTSQREQANSPNSALMSLKDKRVGYFEESNQLEKLNTARVKEIINPGKISGSEKYKVQETFRMVATIVCTSNYDFIINDTDHGSWRRLWYYVSKVVFTHDPRGPFDRKEDKNFICKYVEEKQYREAMLSILVYFYQILQEKYGGDVTTIECPTIEYETRMLRAGQDIVTRFIMANIVRIETPSGDTVPGVGQTEFCQSKQSVGQKISLASIANEYKNWAARENVAKLSIDDSQHAIETSILGSMIKKDENGERYLEGCRILGRHDTIRAGEHHISLLHANAPQIEDKEQWWLPEYIGNY